MRNIRRNVVVTRHTQIVTNAISQAMLLSPRLIAPLAGAVVVGIMTMLANIVMLRGQSRSTVASERRSRNHTASANALKSASELAVRLDKTADELDVPQEDLAREAELINQIKIAALDFSRKSYRENVSTCCFILSRPRTYPPSTSLEEQFDDEPDPEIWHSIQWQLKMWGCAYLLECLGAFSRGKRRCPRLWFELKYCYTAGRQALRKSDRLPFGLLPETNSLRAPVFLRFFDWMEKTFPALREG